MQSNPQFQRFNLRFSFTLIEMVVVIGIITVLLTIVLSAMSTMWHQAHLMNADQSISDILRVAAQRSCMIEHSSYGVFFYVDKRNHQVACFIKWRGYPDQPDVADRFVLDTDGGEWSFDLKDFVRIAPLGILEWTDEQILNDDYQFDKHRNAFVIMFQREKRCTLPTWLEDKDADGDGFGDLTNLLVADVKRSRLITIKDMLVDSENQVLEFYGEWGIMIYDENLYQGLPIAYRPQFIKNQYTRALFMSKFGRTIRGSLTSR